jgi:hypothetical protein
MVNVFFFDLRDANTSNFNKLSDDKYLLWDKKAKEISLDDFCLIYYHKTNSLLETKVVSNGILPQKTKDGDWFIEYNGKQYFYEGSDEYEEFLAFEILSSQSVQNDQDFKLNPYGGVTLLTQSKDSKFKNNKYPKLYPLIHEKDILKALNKYSKITILDAIINALEVLGEATPQEILEEIDRSESFNFGAEEPLNIIRNRLRNHCKGTNNTISQHLYFYRSNNKYGLLSGPIYVSHNSTLLKFKKQTIFYGPPGTGKTYQTKRNAVEAIGNDQMQYSNQNEINQQYDELKAKGQIEFITFHPSYSYEEFVEGITVDIKTTGEATNELRYKLKQGIFKRMVIKSIAKALDPEQSDDELESISLKVLMENYRKTIDEITSDTTDLMEKSTITKKWWDEKPRFVLIIDEINRGDISKIFGELITLLEADKRLGMENELTAKLPYSQDNFGIPPNLYIVGTMNTADKSIALIDIALRRRFAFIEMAPDFKILEKHIENHKSTLEEVYEGLSKSIKAIKRINERICTDSSVGRDRQIGHSFLFKVQNEDDLILVWKHELLPLLEEYYYGQYPRINKLFFDNEEDSNWIGQMEGIKDFETYDDLIRFLDEVK